MNEMRMMHTRVGLQEDHCFVVVTMMSRQNVQVLCTKRCCWNCYFELRTDFPTHPSSTSNGGTLDGSWTVTQKEKAIEHRCTVRGPLDTKSTPLRRVERRGQAATTRTAIGWSVVGSRRTPHEKEEKKRSKNLTEHPPLCRTIGRRHTTESLSALAGSLLLPAQSVGAWPTTFFLFFLIFLSLRSFNSNHQSVNNIKSSQRDVYESLALLNRSSHRASFLQKWKCALHYFEFWNNIMKESASTRLKSVAYSRLWHTNSNGK